MDEEKEQKKNCNTTRKAGKISLKRRTLLKAFAGFPVVGLLGYKVAQKTSYNKQNKEKILKKLGLDEKPVIKPTESSPGNKVDLLRVGIIGYGGRAQALASGLGYLYPGYMDWYKQTGRFESVLNQENLNVALNGICDVFDNHAEMGLATARSEPPGGGPEKKLPVKRYRHYRDMLEDKAIDAVIIATPEHNHASMTIDAMAAGKHVYCEKSFTRSEKETYETYEALRNSKTVFQLGHQGAHGASNQKAKEIIDKGILGKITLIEVTTNRNTANGAWLRHLDDDGNPKPGSIESIDWDQWLGDRPKVPFSLDRFYNWTKWFDYSTGLIGQLFTHDYFSLNFLLDLGIPHSVAASGGIYYWKDNREIPDVLQVALEYPERGLTLLYSSTLASSRSRGDIIMGHDGWMRIGGRSAVTIDRNSTQFEKEIKSGLIDPGKPLITYNRGSDSIDAITSATEQYYADRGLTYTVRGGRRVDTTHLHLREWIDCIRNGGVPSGGDVEKVFEESVVVQMAHKAFIEKRHVTWDPVKRRIV